MNPSDLIRLNAEEVRRRSIKLWEGIPTDKLHWRPDPQARSCIEIIRHVLEGEYLYMMMVRTGRSVADESSPFGGRPYTNARDELNFAAHFHQQYLDFLATLTGDDLTSLKVDRSEVGYVRAAGDILLRAAYHGAVQAGQRRDYFRTMGVGRPSGWDWHGRAA